MHRKPFRVALLCAVALLASPSVATAQTVQPVDLSDLASLAEQRSPAAAFDGVHHLLAWEESGVVRAALRTADGAAAGLPFAVAPAGTQREPAVAAASSGGFLVVWTEVDLGGDANIHGARVSAAGGAGTSFLVSAVDVGGTPGPAPGPQDLAAVSSSGNDFLVVWQDGRAASGAPDIHGALLTSAGLLFDVVVTQTTAAERRPALAWDGATHLVVWEEEDSATGQADLWGNAFDGSGVPAGLAFQISAATGDERHPAVAPGAAGHLVTWTDQTSGATQLMAVGVDASRAPGTPILVSAVDAGAPHAVASGGPGHLSAYQRTGSGTLGARLASDGTAGLEFDIDATGFVAPGQALSYGGQGRFLEVHRTAGLTVPQLAAFLVTTSERLDVALSGTGTGKVLSSPAGIDCGTTCTAELTTDATVTLTATAEAGSVLDGWTGCDSALDATCTVTMSGARSVGATFTSAPAGPAGTPTYTEVGATSARVSWTAADGATAHELERSLEVGGAPDAYALVVAGAITTHVDASLSPNTTYWYRARGTNPAGPGPYGVETSVTTLPGAPGTPTFSAVGSTSVTVSWTAPAGGANSYALERAPSSGTEWTLVDTVTGLSHVDSSLAADTAYLYRVRAIGAGGTGAYSAEASVTTLPLPPGTPAQPTFSGVEASTITVSWTAVDGATSYDLERATAAGGPFAAVAQDVAATTHVDATVTPNATFWYRVVAKNAGGSSAPSIASSVTTLPGAPGTPVLSGVTTTDVTVTWTAPASGADGYEVERATSAGTDWAPITTTTALTFGDSGLTAGTTYQYRVRATNATGAGEYSATASVTTVPLPPAAPAAPTYGSIGATSVQVSWLAVDGATSYELQRGPALDGPWIVVATDLATTTYLDAALSPNVTSWYQVRGRNSGGDGPFSESSSVTTLPGAPGAPTFPTITSTGVTISWTAPAGGATTYKLERADSTGTWTEIAPALATTEFSDGSLASNATYRYRVRATNATGDGAYSPEASVTTLPAAPGTPTFGSVAETSLVVSWTPPAGGTDTYEVQRSPTGTGSWTTIASGVTTLSHADSGLAVGTNYWYQVRAVTSAGASAYSASAQVITLPGAPGDPVLSGVTTTDVTVTWTAPASGADGYEVERATSAGTDWARITTTTALTFGDGGLTPGTTYQYRVRATNVTGAGDYSGIASVTTVPLAPAAPTYGSIGATSVQVSWNAVEGATSYELQRGPGPDGTWTAVTTGLTTTYLDPVLLANTTYWYRVRGSSTGGEGTFSSASSVTTLPGAPGIPTFPTIASTGVTITWTAPAGGATTYKLERADSTGTWTEIAPALATTEFSDGSLASNATYRYRVRASNATGDGAYSAEASVTTLPAAPGTPTFGSVTETSLAVSWTAPTGGADGYEVQRSPTGTDSWTTIASGVTTLSYLDSGLAVGTTYWYQVRAVTAAGASAYSAPAQVITLPGTPGTPVFANVGATSATVSWSAAVGAASYRIERAPDNGGAPSGAWEELASGVAGPPYDSTGLASNATYWYRVRATNASGDGAYSAAAAVTTLPAAPGTPTYTGVTTSGLTVSWTEPSGGASSYEVERASSATGTFTLVGTPSGLSQVETGLASGTTYWYRVRAVTSTGLSAYSAASQVITLPLAPGTPTFSSIGTTAITVSWTAPVGAATYKLERAPDSGSNAPGAWTEIRSALTGTTFTDTGRTANTRYWYRVRATNASGHGDYSPHAGVMTRPNAPGGPTFSAVTTTGMTVSWTAPTGGAASYDLERGTSANGPWTVLATATPALSFTDSGLAPGTTYWYRVRAANADGLYGAYATTSRPTLPEAPAAPTFTDVASFSLTVNWVAVTGATSYKLERALDDGTGAAGTWTELAAGITVTTFAETALTADTRYWYRVRATNASGDGAYSGAEAVITLPTGPGKPTFSSILSTSLLVSWTAPPEGAASYELERALSASGTWTVVETGITALEQADSGLASGTTYYYRVRAANADGAFGPWSQIGWATTLPDSPGAPTYSQISTVSLTVHWTEITGATTYHVERALDAAGQPGTWELVAEGLSFNYNNDATAPNTTYWYRVRGANESGYGSYSPASSVTTLANAPGAPTFSNVATTSLTVSWTAPSGGAASYVVERAPALTGPWAAIQSGVAALSHDDTGLAPDTVYWYRIRATNASGATGSPGTPASVRTLPAAPATAPGAPTYANVGTGSVTVSWTDASTATSWKLERAPDAGNVPGAWTPAATVSTRSYTDAALAPNTTYWYRVQGSTAGGDGPHSEPSSVVTLPLAPGAPTFADVQTASVSVSWTAPAGGAATYHLERASSATGPWTVLIGGTATLTHFDTGLSANTTYHYRVRAANVAGAPGAYSTAASVTTAPDWTVTAPEAPGAPTYSTVRATSVTVSWSGSAGAETYTLERSGDAGGASDGAWAVVATTTWTSVIDSGRAANTVYWYRVRATNAGGDGPWSAATQVMTAPNAPGAPSFSAVLATTLTVSWTAPPGGAASYAVERATASIGPWVQVAAGVATTTYDDSGLTGNQTYHYRVRAANLAGIVGAPSASKAVLTAADETTPLPPAPGTPTFPTIAASYVKVAWGTASGAASYLLERAPASTGSWTQIASVTATTFTDTGRAPNTTYWYRVRGSSGGGYGPYSEAASVMTAPTAPGAPTFGAVGVGTLTVSWAAPASGAASYKVERALSALGPWAEIAAGVAATQLDDAGLAGNTTYHYRVRATNATGVDGVYSVARSVTTTADGTTSPPGAPGTPTFASVTATSLGITWTAAPDATSHELERATAAGGPFTRIATATGTSFTDTWRSPNTAYWYRVRGANSGGFGAYSAEGAVMTAPGAPGAPSFPTVGATAVTLSWAAPAGGAATYEVERSTAAYGPWAQVAQGIADTTLVDGGLTGSTTYYYRVRATNLEGTDGAYSASRSVTTLADPATLPPGQPGAPAYARVTASWLEVSWTSASGATSYELDRAPDGSGSLAWSTIARGLTATAYTDTGRSANTKYWYRVRGVNAGGAGPGSSETSVITAPHAPGAPSFTQIGSTSVTASWAAPSGGAASYAVERATSLLGPWSTVASVLVTEYADETVAGNTTYYYRIRAANASGLQGRASSVASVTTEPDGAVAVPAAPGAPTFPVVTSTWLSVSWTSVPGASGYHLERADTSTGSWTAIASTSSTSHTDFGRTGNTSYWYRVRAWNAGGEGEYSGASRITTAPGAPGVPSFSALGPSSVTLAWAAPAGGADSYGVERATSTSGPWVSVARASTLEHIDTTVTGNTTYHYRVRGRNADGLDGPASVAASVTTPVDPDVAPAGAAGPITVSGIWTSWVDLIWTGATSATVHELERAPDASGQPGTWAWIASVTTTAHTDFGRSANTRYWYRVRGSSAGGYGSYSDPVGALTAPNAPGAPTFSAIGTAEVTVSWTAPAGGAATYALERSTSSAGPWTVVAPGLTALTHTDDGVAAGIEYWYRVRATNAEGTSGSYSLVRAVTTAAVPGS